MLKQVIEVMELLDSALVTGPEVKGLLEKRGLLDITLKTISGDKGSTDAARAVKEGWVLKVSEDLLDIMGWTTGEFPKVCPISTQDITPYGNDLYHINSIMQPCARYR